ncbi:MAG: methylated-DNA--[protein]-cysteine S-methyltransferase [Pseudomonadota bacterium]
MAHSQTKKSPLAGSNDVVNEQISYDIGICRYGSVLCAASEKGLCAIFLGDHPEKLLNELYQQFPGAEIVVADADFEKTLITVIKYIEKPDRKPRLKLDIRGTRFQVRTWQAISQIAFGKTSSYTEIAMKLGSPKSVRAVAQACGANKLAVVIPCHRVIRLDKKLSGYRWGLELKKALLAKEGVIL